MKDIKNAIQAQQEYRQALEVNPFKTNIYEYLAPYGYTDLDDFTSDKIEYLLKNSNIPITITTPEVGIAITLDNFTHDQQQAVFGINNEKIYAWHCNDDINTELFNDYGIPIYETGTEGGTILGSPDDLDIALILSHDDFDECNFYKYFNNRLAAYLCAALPEHEVVADNNDILIDSKKIMGSSIAITDNCLLYVAHISFYDFSALAEILCDKNSNKTPGCVPAELSRATLLEEIESWFK